MNILLPVFYKNQQYNIEYNEPDSTPEHHDYVVRIESIKSQAELHAEMEEQIGKEFTFSASEHFAGDSNLPLDLIKKTYCDHIIQDVDKINRV